MKNLSLTLIVAFAAITTTFAQPILQWATIFNGPIANDEGKAIALDANGNIYVAGSSDGLSGTSDFLALKYNKDGSLLWSQRYNGAANGQDSVRAIRVDASGNVYITGKSQGAGTNINIVTIKYDSTGVQKWASVYNGTAGSNGGYSLEVDVFGNVYVVGFSNPYDVVIKYNGLGVLQWSKNLHNSFNNQKEFYFAISPFDGHLIAVDGGSLTSEYTIWKLHPSTGNVVQTYNTNNGGNIISGIPNSLVLDATGNIYVTSMSDPDLNTDKPNRIHTAKFTQGSSYYAWYHYTYVSGNVQTLSGVDMKIDNNANLYILAKWYTGSEYVFFTKMLTAAGSQVWAKPSNSSEGIKGTPVSLSLGQLSNPPDIYETGFTSTGNIKIIKYTNGGDTLWTNVYDCGNNGVDIATKMTIDACDNIYITGSSNCDGTYKDIKTLKYAALTPTITPNGPTTFCQGGSVTLTASVADGYQWSTGATTQSITASSSGVYSVTITNANQCTAASSGITVLVNPIPIVTVNSLTICAGQQAILTANGAATYLWNTGATTSSITVNPMATTTYSVTGTTANCASAPASAQVTVNSLPTVTVNSPTICAGQQTTLTANGATAYLWNTGATTSIITVSPNSTTTYTVTGTSAMCSSSATAQVFANPLLTPSVSILGPSVLCLGQNATYTATPTNGGPSPTYEWFVNFVNNTPVGTGPTYSTTTLINGDQIYCVLTSNAACLTTNTSTSPITTVTVLPLPNVQITPSGPTTFCAGGSVTLMASPTGNYLWSTGATTKNIPVSTGGVYIVTVTVASGCSAVSTPTTVTVKPPQSTPMIIPTGPIPLCPGEEVELTSTFANAYLWNTGETTQSITVSILGDYSVTVTNQDSCSAISPPTSVQLCVIRVSETNLPEGFNISPNPSAGLFTVKFFLPEATIVAQRVLNVLGQVVWTAAPGLESGEYHREIDLGRGVTPGIYFLETRLDGRAFLRKVEVR